MTGLFIYLIDLLYYAIVILIFARFILSFVQIGSYDIRSWVWRLTEPMLAPIRRYLPATAGLDFSPLIVLLLAGLLRRLLVGALIGL
jgi:YggT family protein